MSGIIYEPKGKAREYCELALNLYTGCNHACGYCFAPGMLRMTREEFGKPEPRLDVLLRLDKDLQKHDFAGREVFLCFSTDPYNEADEKYQLTRQAIKMLHAHGVKVRILTKAGFAVSRDFDLLAARPDLRFYGATLTFIDEADSKKWEPEATPPLGRMLNLEEMHRRGVPTWASLEPIIDPEQTLALIEATHEYVDVYKVGKWNHDARAKEIDWRDFHDKAIALLTKYGKEFYIKKDLREAAKERMGAHVKD